LCAYRRVDDKDTWPFYVTREGVLHATGAVINGSGTFTGTIYANDGYFKGDISGASGTFSG
jgi:hypothetical protein